jgi:hypothetical protein
MLCFMLVVLSSLQGLNTNVDGFQMQSSSSTRLSMSSTMPTAADQEAPSLDSMVPTSGLIEYIGRTSALPELIDESGYLPKYQAFVRQTVTQRAVRFCNSELFALPVFYSSMHFCVASVSLLLAFALLCHRLRCFCFAFAALLRCFSVALLLCRVCCAVALRCVYVAFASYPCFCCVFSLPSIALLLHRLACRCIASVTFCCTLAIACVSLLLCFCAACGLHVLRICFWSFFLLLLRCFCVAFAFPSVVLLMRSLCVAFAAPSFAFVAFSLCLALLLLLRCLLLY